MTCRVLGLLSTLTLSLFVASLTAVVQPAGKVSRIGLLFLSSSEPQGQMPARRVSFCRLNCSNPYRRFADTPRCEKDIICT
jgi:hypothetical protein